MIETQRSTSSTESVPLAALALFENKPPVSGMIRFPFIILDNNGAPAGINTNYNGVNPKEAFTQKYTTLAENSANQNKTTTSFSAFQVNEMNPIAQDRSRFEFIIGKEGDIEDRSNKGGPFEFLKDPASDKEALSDPDTDGYKMENNFTVPDDYLNSDKRVEGGLILLTLNEEENKKNLKPVEQEISQRHCAFCLILCTPKLCGVCKKRAYCSAKCEETDKIGGKGQQHGNWCRLHECGEEDVEWQIVPIQNKGLGVKAKTFIPAGYKIIVEPLFTSPTDHPGFKDLEPEDESLQQKFQNNTFSGFNYRDDGQNGTPQAVAMRIARVNHSCWPNAGTIYDETARVAILFAQRDIFPRDEITTCYYDRNCNLTPLNPSRFLDTSLDWFIGTSSSVFVNVRGILDRLTEASVHNLNVELEEFHLKRAAVLSRYRIKCPEDCQCRNSEMQLALLIGKQLTYDVNNFEELRLVEEALKAGEILLNVHRHLNVSLTFTALLKFKLFEIAVTKSRHFNLARQYIQSVFEHFNKICPYSENLTRRFKRHRDRPEQHRNFRLRDEPLNELIDELIDNM